MLSIIYKSKYSIYLFLFTCLYFVFFQHLDSFHIRNWDESLFAVNAYEMLNNGNFIVPYYKDSPDLWNSKPPMQIWSQIIFIKAIGFNELAIRLPSAIASSFSALLLFYFFKTRFNKTIAILVFLVFITSFGVATFHTGRTGDSDALLSFFLLYSCFYFYKWIFEKKEISIFYFLLFLSFAFLTKSIAALLFLPAFFITILMTKKTAGLLKSTWFYFGFFLFTVTCGGYLLLRELGNTGYISYFLNNDIGRVSKIIESHDEPFDFYLNNLFEYRFLWLILCLPGAMLLWKKSSDKNMIVFLLSLILCYFIIISSSTTKLEWYDLPIMPFLSILSAFCLYTIINNQLIAGIKNKSILIGLIFLLPLYYSFRSSYKSEIKPAEKKLEILTEYAFKNKKNDQLNGTTFITSVFDRPLFFYKYYLNTRSKDFEITNTIDSIKVNDIVIVSDDSLQETIKNRYVFSILDSMKNVQRIQITGVKELTSN